MHTWKIPMQGAHTREKIIIHKANRNEVYRHTGYIFMIHIRPRNIVIIYAGKMDNKGRSLSTVRTLYHPLNMIL